MSAQEQEQQKDECVLITPEYTHQELKPITVALHAQQIGSMWAAHVTPKGFEQALLAEFRAAGAPVTGIVDLRLTCGYIHKLQRCALGKEWVAYIWIPPTLYKRLVEWRRTNGIDKALEPYAVGVA